MRIIAVVRPQDIPGGMETVMTVVRELEPNREFKFIECSMKTRHPIKTPREDFNRRRSSRLAEFGLHSVPEALVSVACSHGTERVHRLGRTWRERVVYFSAHGKRGLSGHGSHGESTVFDVTEAHRMLHSVLRLRML